MSVLDLFPDKFTPQIREAALKRMLEGPKTGSLIKHRQKLTPQESEDVLLVLLAVEAVNRHADFSKEELAHLRGISVDKLGDEAAAKNEAKKNANYKQR